MRRDLTPFEKFAAALVVLMIAVSLFAAGSYAGRGAAVLKAAFPAGAVDAVQLGTPALGPNVTWAQGFLVEVVLTFFLMFAIFGTAVDTRGPASIAGLVIGLMITADIFAGGALTGAAMNPARAFGPALVQGVWQDQWLYWAAPIVGALLAAFLYNGVLLEPAPLQREPAMELPQRNGARKLLPRELVGTPRR